MPVRMTAGPFVPQSHRLPVLQKAVQACHGCDLYKNATQAVFGETQTKAGKSAATIMFVGEQPGNQEDKEGHPFVGPAGKLLDRALAEAGIDRQTIYVTNAVKHFKWEPRGKLRIHKKPSTGEIHACRPWLNAELDAVKPALVVCLGATAAQALLGPRFKITKSHGAIQHPDDLPPIIATLHPSAILRARTDEDRHQQMATFVSDLKRVAAFSDAPKAA